MLASLATLGAACTHRRPLAHAYTIETGRSVTVQTTTGTYIAVSVQTATGVAYQFEGGGLVDPGTIVSVTDERTLRGAAEGMGIGAGAGALAGVLLGFADGDDPPCGDSEWCFFNLTAGEKAVLGGIAFGGLGAIVGLVIGGVAGSDDVYEGHSAGPTITPGGPPGSVAGATLTF